jgi:hypothetical protein
MGAARVPRGFDADASRTATRHWPALTGAPWPSRSRRPWRTRTTAFVAERSLGLVSARDRLVAEALVSSEVADRTKDVMSRLACDLGEGGRSSASNGVEGARGCTHAAGHLNGGTDRGSRYAMPCAPGCGSARG